MSKYVYPFELDEQTRSDLDLLVEKMERNRPDILRRLIRRAAARYKKTSDDGVRPTGTAKEKRVSAGSV